MYTCYYRDSGLGGNARTMSVASRQATLSIHRFMTLYMVALSSIALLTILGQVLLLIALQQTSSDALIISVVGRQQILSQEVSKAALAIEVSILKANTQTRQHYKTKLSSTLTQWQQAHNELRNGDTRLTASSKNSSAMIRFSSTMEPYYLAILNASYTLLASINAPSPPSRAMIAASVYSILHEEPTYLTLMNDMVTLYQYKVAFHLFYLLYIEFVLPDITAVVLIVEDLFVFSPIIQKIQSAMIQTASQWLLVKF